MMSNSGSHPDDEVDRNGLLGLNVAVTLPRYRVGTLGVHNHQDCPHLGLELGRAC